MSHVASPHCFSSRSVSSGRAEVAKSRSLCGRPSMASRTGPPTSASSWPASANRVPSSSVTGRIRSSSTSALRWSSTTVSADGSDAGTGVNSIGPRAARRIPGCTGSGTNLLGMLRRLSISAALAALAVPVALAGPVHADPGDPPADDPGAQAQQRKQQATSPSRKQPVSRAGRAARARAEDDAPLSVSIDQLSPSTIPDQGRVRVSGLVTNNDTETWSTINVRPFISETPLTTPEQLAEAAAMPTDAVVGERINDERHKDFIEELAPGESMPYTISVPRRLMHVSTPGVYWFGVHALGENAA